MTHPLLRFYVFFLRCEKWQSIGSTFGSATFTCGVSQGWGPTLWNRPFVESITRSLFTRLNMPLGGKEKAILKVHSHLVLVTLG